MTDRRIKLRTTGEQALANGDGRRAFKAYAELEQLDPNEALWPKRAAEAARKAGKNAEAASAFRRAAAVYLRLGFASHAQAMTKLAAQLETLQPS